MRLLLMPSPTILIPKYSILMPNTTNSNSTESCDFDLKCYDSGKSDDSKYQVRRYYTILLPNFMDLMPDSDAKSYDSNPNLTILILMPKLQILMQNAVILEQIF